MKKIMVCALSLVVIAGFWGCGKKVKRIDVAETVDLSGKWNDTDSRLVSEEMMKDCLARPWVVNYVQKSGEKPTVIVGTVVNKTDEHIISETFTKDLERALINSGQVQMVASKEERKEIREEREEMQENASAESVKELKKEEAADFMLKGVINAIEDKEGKKKIMYYQIDLELIDTETNQKSWIGDKKIKKYIKN
ncbi:penicillin-binding protein activator LpoB [Elusimicrobiota bacterium]